MVTTNYGLIRTVQVRNENVPGVLGALSTAIGITGANISNIQTVRISQNHVLRDIDIYVEDQEHLNETLRAIARVQGVRVIETRDEVMDLHQGGKIEIVSRQRVESIACCGRSTRPEWRRYAEPSIVILAWRGASPLSAIRSRSSSTAPPCLVWAT